MNKIVHPRDFVRPSRTEQQTLVRAPREVSLLQERGRPATGHRSPSLKASRTGCALRENKLEHSATPTTAVRTLVHQSTYVNRALPLPFSWDNCVKYYYPHAYYFISFQASSKCFGIRAK